MLIFSGLATTPLSLSMQGTKSTQPALYAAIDFGSGAIKIQMAAIDTDRNPAIGMPLLSKYISLGLTEDVASHAGHISQEMAQEALRVLCGFKEEAQRIAAQKGYPWIHFTGVATAVFRKAHNGSALLETFAQQLGIPFQILSQDEEGKLGFFTAQALYPDASEDSLLAWDSGNGSFQMTIKEDGNYKIYQGPIGHGTVRVLLSKEIRNREIVQTHESVNPILREEAIELIDKIKILLPLPPKWLREKLNSERIVIASFGDNQSIFALVAQAISNLNGLEHPIQQALISCEDVQRVIDTYIGQEDEVFAAHGLHLKTLTSALYLSALMQHFEIRQIHYKRSLGNTPGMLYRYERSHQSR